MSVEGLAGLLTLRLEQSGRVGDPVVSVAELHRTLLPYHLCRSSLGYATKAEYDLELLELLDEERFLVPAEGELVVAVREERGSPEPGLGFLKNFSAAQLQIQPELAPAQSEGSSVSPTRAARSRDEPAGRSATEAVGVDDGSAAEPASQSRSCWKCGRGLPVREGLLYCVFCGSDQRTPHCPECDEELEEGWRFCPSCGSEQSRAPSEA